MARIVRASKFRHIFGTPEKNDKCYNDIRTTRSAWDSNFCAVNPKFVALAIEGGGGGPFLVLRHDEYGRVSKTKAILDGHSAPVLDLQWSPFNDNIIATCAEDCTIKIWLIPDEGVLETSREAQLTLTGHQRRVLIVSWHPVAENVLLSSGADNMIVLWDVGNGCALTEISCHPDNPLSVSWNYDGSLLATTCKDKTLRVIDPRSSKVVQSRKNAHDGTKTSKVVFLKDGRLMTFGFSRMSDRQYALWDSNELSEPILMEDIDRASGVLFPFYDPDTEIIFVAGKGDGSIRYFEITQEAPFVHYISTFQSQQSQRGLGWMPKRGCDTSKCEITRFYKLHATKIEPISFTVPRKSELFQADIFPHTPSNEPALSCEDWWSGRNCNPRLMDLREIHTSNSGKKPQTTRALGGSGVGLGSRFGASGTAVTRTAMNSSPGADQMNGSADKLNRIIGNQNGGGAAAATVAGAAGVAGVVVGKGGNDDQGAGDQRNKIKSGHVSSSPFMSQTTNAAGMPRESAVHSSLTANIRDVKRTSSVGQVSAPDLNQIVLPEGLNVQELLDDIKKMKATIKKQGRRIAQLESKLGIEKEKKYREGETV